MTRASLEKQLPKTIRHIGLISLLSIVQFSGASVVFAQDNDISGKSKTHITANMDRTINPGDDFYKFANGVWLKNNPVPNEYDKWGVLAIITDRNMKRVKRILEEVSTRPISSNSSSPSALDRKIADFYATGMNQEAIDTQGIEPIAKELALIDNLASKEELPSLLAKLHLIGVNSLFRISSGQDYKNSEEVIAQLYQGGLGLPDRDYYLNDDKKSEELRAKYEKHIARMFELSGHDTERAQKSAATVMKIETALARASMKNTDRRVPENVYHRMSLAELEKLAPAFGWRKYLEELGHAEIKELNVGQPRFIEAISLMLDNQSQSKSESEVNPEQKSNSGNQSLWSPDLNEWRQYLRWHLIDASCPYLASKLEEANFDFFGKVLTGKVENLPRWKRVINTMDNYMGEAVGQLYTEEYFTPRAKEKALRLVEKLKEVLADELATLSWMEDETRKNALKKLSAFRAKIGYPNIWRDYSKLEVQRDSYVRNIFRAEEFEFHRQMDKIGKPVDREEWFMSPQTVNAYYSPLRNEIVFPAGILQPPIFDPDADDATNLGAMGMIIGHEMTHGFDDQGSKFDAEGNLREWWTARDRQRFQEQIARIEKQYQSYKISSGENFKGKLVAGEAAADLGGLTIAFKALLRLRCEEAQPDKQEFTPEQRFFISFAQAWATNIRPEKERMMVAVDPHPTPHFRVNGTLANMDEFVKAFSLKEDSAIMLPPEDRCRIW